MRAVTQGNGTHAMRSGLDQGVLFDSLGQQDDRYVLAAAGDLRLQGAHGDLLRLTQDGQIDLARQHVGQFLLVLRPRRAHRNAAVTQRGDDGLGTLHAVVDDHQAEGEIFAFCMCGSLETGFNTPRVGRVHVWSMPHRV